MSRLPAMASRKRITLITSTPFSQTCKMRFRSYFVSFPLMTRSSNAMQLPLFSLFDPRDEMGRTVLQYIHAECSDIYILFLNNYFDALWLFIVKCKSRYFWILLLHVVQIVRPSQSLTIRDKKSRMSPSKLALSITPLVPVKPKPAPPMLPLLTTRGAFPDTLEEQLDGMFHECCW